MNRTLMLIAIATLTAFGQKIETQKPDRNKITRLGTTQNHLSVIELAEPVTQVAAGSSSFKIEWRENKVFIQPLEPDATTNLFIWTASGRLSYELVPAGSVEQMHFAIDQDPGIVQAKKEEAAEQAPVVQQPKIPAAMLMESTPVTLVGSSKTHQKVKIVVQDVYQKDGRVYLRQRRPDGLPISGSGGVYSEFAARAAVVGPAGQQPACRRLPAQVERRGTGPRRPHRVAGSRRSAWSNRPWRDRVRTANLQRTGATNGCQTGIPGGHGRQRECGPGAVAMVEDRQVTTEDVLEAARRRRRLCDDVEVDDPVTANAVLTAFEARMEQRLDLGVVNRALNVFLEPRNPFEPERTRKPKMEAVIFGMLFGVAIAAFLLFNLAAPRLQVHP